MYFNDSSDLNDSCDLIDYLRTSRELEGQ